MNQAFAVNYMINALAMRNQQMNVGRQMAHEGYTRSQAAQRGGHFLDGFDAYTAEAKKIEAARQNAERKDQSFRASQQRFFEGLSQWFSDSDQAMGNVPRVQSTSPLQSSSPTPTARLAYESFTAELKAAREQGVKAASIDIENGVVFHRNQSSNGQPSLTQQEYIDGYYSGWSEIYRVRAETLRIVLKQQNLSPEVLKDLNQLNSETLRRWKEVDAAAVKSFLGKFNGFKIPRKGFDMSFGDFRANEVLDQHVFRFREGKNPLPKSRASKSFTIVPISLR